MIESIAEIGRVHRQIADDDMLDLIVECPNVDKMLAICVDTKNKTAKVRDEGDATRDKIVKALYTEPPKNGPGAAPTAKLNVNKPQNTLRGKIAGWFKGRGQDSIAEIISKNVSAKDIKKQLGSAKSAILTVKIDGKWPAEIQWVTEEFWNYLRGGMHTGNYGGRRTTSKSKGICSICGKETEVFGFTLPWAGMKFATADKPGFFEGLDPSRAWKVLPVCGECGWNVRVGWITVTCREKGFSVGGLHYLVFPSRGASDDDVKGFIESIKSPRSKFAVFSEIASAEEEIEDIETNADLLVYRREQAKMEVYLLEQNIPPGVFRRIRRRSHQIAKIIGWERSRTPKESRRYLEILSAYLEILRATYADEKKKTKKLKEIARAKELAQVIHAMIRGMSWPGRKYAYFVRYIEKRAHNEKKGLDYAYLAPLFAYIYFTGGDKLSDNVVKNIKFPSKTAEFAFWTGVLARHVIKMQEEAMSRDSSEPRKGAEQVTEMQEETTSKDGSKPRKGSEPFRKRIRNIRMSVHQLQRLFTEAFEKAKTYSEMLGEPWITWTNGIVEQCAKRATNLRAATPDEIGFFFAVGYGLYWEVVKPGNEKGGEENEE